MEHDTRANRGDRRQPAGWLDRIDIDGMVVMQHREVRDLTTRQAEVAQAHCRPITDLEIGPNVLAQFKELHSQAVAMCFRILLDITAQPEGREEVMDRAFRYL